MLVKSIWNALYETKGSMMAGHSKWANIKHRKEKADRAKGKLFSRIMKELISAVKQAGPDPKTNPKLRLVLQKAKEANIPNENIERNIKKAASSDQSDYVEMIYELYGHGGVGILIEVMTDNKNRIASDLRIATNKKGGVLAGPGAVAFNFVEYGVIYVSKESIDEDSLFIQATQVGAEDFKVSDTYYIILTAPQDLYRIKEELRQSGILCEKAELERVPKSYVECDSEKMRANLELIDWLEALDDVDAVYHNMKL